MYFFSYKIGSKKSIWKWEVFFTLEFIWNAPDESIIHYLEAKSIAYIFPFFRKFSLSQVSCLICV